MEFIMQIFENVRDLILLFEQMLLLLVNKKNVLSWNLYRRSNVYLSMTALFKSIHTYNFVP